MTRPVILDLYSGAGGAARGYHDAGFDVVGADIKLQPHYPYRHVVRDLTEPGTIPALVQRYRPAAIHASPPCQFGTALRHAPGAREHTNLIPHTLAQLSATGLPWVIENVDSNEVRPHMPGAICLCGSMFGLGCKTNVGWCELRRHRLFMSNWWGARAPGPCRHTIRPTIGVYGGHVRNRGSSSGGRGTRDFVGLDKPALAKAAMGIDWMTMDEMSQAIPPAYTRWLGGLLVGLLP